MVTDREAWLKLTTQEPIEPDLPLCDPHHYFSLTLELDLFFGGQFRII